MPCAHGCMAFFHTRLCFFIVLLTFKARRFSTVFFNFNIASFCSFKFTENNRQILKQVSRTEIRATKVVMIHNNLLKLSRHIPMGKFRADNFLFTLTYIHTIAYLEIISSLYIFQLQWLQQQCLVPRIEGAIQDFGGLKKGLLIRSEGNVKEINST